MTSEQSSANWLCVNSRTHTLVISNFGRMVTADEMQLKQVDYVLQPAVKSHIKPIKSDLIILLKSLVAIIVTTTKK